MTYMWKHKDKATGEIYLIGDEGRLRFTVKKNPHKKKPSDPGYVLRVTRQRRHSMESYLREKIKKEIADGG